MFRGRFFTTALAFLVLTALLLAGGYALARAGWSQGYSAGLQAGGSEIAPVVPFRPYGPLALGFFPLFCGFGLLFFFGLFMLRFLFFGRRAWGWHKHGRAGEGPWSGPWHSDRRPPWHRDPPEEATEPPASADQPTGPIFDA